MLSSFADPLTDTPGPTALYKKDCTASLAKYSTLLREQDHILDGQKDFAVLCTGLKQLPNLKQVSVLDQFSTILDYTPFLWGESEFEWYEQWSSGLYKGVARPTRWSEADMTDEGIHMQNSPWDFRGLQHLFIALDDSASQLQELYLGCQIANLSTAIYSQKEHTRILRRIVPQLTSFKMDCRIPCEHSLRPQECVTAVEVILQEARNLTSLSLSVPTLPDRMDGWTTAFAVLRWPRLRTLDLGDGVFESQDFQAIANAHAETLLELRLRNVYILDEVSWEEIATELGKTLQLQMIALLSMADNTGLEETDSPYLDDDRHQDAARLFMQRIPPNLLGLRTSEGSTIAWHKQDFKPAYDLDRLCGE